MYCLLFNQRFDLEEKTSGACVDYLNIHDGAATTAGLLATQLCGSVTNTFNYTTSGQSVTFHFKSDNTGNFRGFEVLYVAISRGIKFVFQCLQNSSYNVAKPVLTNNTICDSGNVF